MSNKVKIIPLIENDVLNIINENKFVNYFH